MACNDPIADMLTRIRNANTAKHDTVDVPASKMKKDRMSRLLASRGVREVGRDIAEIPEKETGHGRNDGRRIKNTMQDIHQDNDNGV